MTVEQFANTAPKLNPLEYFYGKTWAYGLFQDRFGNVKRTFKVDLQGERENNTLRLVEDFYYNDGEEQQRIWTISETGKGKYIGRADDIVGVAQGKSQGSALNWHYQMDLPIGSQSWRVRFNDWMFLQPGHILINRATVSKWGVELGTVTIVFTKHAPQENQKLPQTALSKTVLYWQEYAK